MKYKLVIGILALILLMGILIFPNDVELTGNVIKENNISEEVKLDNEKNVSEELTNDIEFEITKTEFISYIDEKLNERNKLIIEGVLINNLYKDLNKLEAQARFYNEMSKDDELVHLKGYINIPLKVWATNQYINRHAFFYVKDSSSKVFQNGETSFELTFYDVPQNIPREPLLDGGIESRGWFKGNYDIDFTDLIIYNEGKEIDKVNLGMPQRYISDISVNISGMNWINPGGHKTLLDSISFIIKNPEQNNLKYPKIVFTAYDEKTREQISTFTIKIPKNKIESPINYVRLISEEDYPMKFDEEILSHLALFELYDGEELIDRNYFNWDCKEIEILDTISYFPCLTLTPWIYLKEDSGVDIKIIELFAGGKENYYTGIEVKVIDEGGINKMIDPIIEILCGNSRVYDFDISQTGEFINLDFVTGAFCTEPRVFLRERDSSVTYSEDTYFIDEQLK